MTAYLLDTNLPSELTKPEPSPLVLKFLTDAGRGRAYLSVITIGEICRGVATLPQSRRRDDLQHWLDHVMRPWFQDRILPVTESIAERWGRLAAEQRGRGCSIAMADGLIAATALEHNLTLVTRNSRDFQNLGLTVLNPWQEA